VRTWRVRAASLAAAAAVAGTLAACGGAVDALAVSGGKLTVWRLAAAAAGWSKIQTINVPVQYGSSG